MDDSLLKGSPRRSLLKSHAIPTFLQITFGIPPKGHPVGRLLPFANLRQVFPTELLSVCIFQVGKRRSGFITYPQLHQLVFMADEELQQICQIYTLGVKSFPLRKDFKKSFVANLCIFYFEQWNFFLQVSSDSGCFPEKLAFSVCKVDVTSLSINRYNRQCEWLWLSSPLLEGTLVLSG